MNYEETKEFYGRVIETGDIQVIRRLCQTDRFFLLTQALGVEVAMHPWVFDRCREVEADPDEHLDLWSRGHFKSTIITYAGVIQYLLNDPEKTVCIMSYKAGAAQAFLQQIKTAFETSPILLPCFPDILYPENKDHKGEKWSVQGGLYLKRKTARKEASVMASGLVEGQLTGGHYDLLVYDDAVTLESVSTPEQSQKVTDAWSMSLNLGTDDSKHWYIGTRYAIYDTYADMIERGIKERRHIAINRHGEPVYWSKAQLEQRRREMSTKDWASQILQEPTGEGELVFKPEWFHTVQDMPHRSDLNVYILVDSANSKDKQRDSDYTVMTVWGLGRDRNYYLLDACRDRMSLTERTETLFALVERWTPTLTFWEQIGAMSDVQHVQVEMDRRGWHFPITSLHQSVHKADRIRWLEPLFREGRIWLPNMLKRCRTDGSAYDFIYELKHDEYLSFPSVRHDDMLDCMANIMHPTFVGSASWPITPTDPRIAVRKTPKTEWKPW